MARGKKRKSTAKSFSDFKKSQNEKRLNRIYSQGQKDYANQNKGQSGGSSSIPSSSKKDAFVNLQRQKFFGGRKVPEERVFKRTAQDTNLELFKKRFTKPVNIVDPNTGEVTGTVSGLTQATDDAPRSLTEERQRLVNLYGPTNKEVMGDIGFGLGNLIKSYGIPFVSPIMKGMNVIKSGVEAAWDKVRREPSQQTFPEFRGESQNYFNNVDTGISQVDPNNMLVRIAKENEGKFDDASTFQEQLANATAMNLNIPNPVDIAQTISDYYDAAAQGVNLDLPIGNLNLNPLAQKVFLDGGIGNVRYGGAIDPNTLDYNLGISTALPGDFRLSAGASSSDLPGISLSNTYKPEIFGKNIPGISNVTPSLNMSGQGDLSLGVNTTVDPLRSFYPGAAIGTPINVGASVDSRGNITPNISFLKSFKDGGAVNSGLGYMFK